MFKFFDPISVCFAKYDTFCSLIFDYACSRRRLRLITIEEVRNYGKIVQAYIKNIVESGWWRMHTPHPTLLDLPLAISYRNHQKSLAYFSSLAPLLLFFLIERRSQKGGPWPNGLHPKYATGQRHYAVTAHQLTSEFD